MEILYIAPSIPNEFSRIRTVNLLKSFKENGCKVTIVALCIEKKELEYLNKLSDKVIFVNSRKIIILYNGCDVDNMKQLAEQVYNCFPKSPEEDKTAKVSIVKCYQGDYYTSEKEIRRVEVDINENYNDDFKKVYDDTVKFLEDRSSGLILFYGPAGSGKTHLQGWRRCVRVRPCP